MPSHAPARGLLWLALAAASLFAAARAPTPPQTALIHTAHGCVLGPAADGEPCGCGELPGDVRRLLGLPLLLNTASAAELELLSDVGPVRARAIQDTRRRRGGFSSLADLREVPGLGPRRVERLRAQVVVDAPDPACVLSAWSPPDWFQRPRGGTP